MAPNTLFQDALRPNESGNTGSKARRGGTSQLNQKFLPGMKLLIFWSNLVSLFSSFLFRQWYSHSLASLCLSHTMKWLKPIFNDKVKMYGSLACFKSHTFLLRLRNLPRNQETQRRSHYEHISTQQSSLRQSKNCLCERWDKMSERFLAFLEVCSFHCSKQSLRASSFS